MAGGLRSESNLERMSLAAPLARLEIPPRSSCCLEGVFCEVDSPKPQKNMPPGVQKDSHLADVLALGGFHTLHKE